MPDLLEDILAFVYATQPDQNRTCSNCGADLEENEDGEFHCPNCDR